MKDLYLQENSSVLMNLLGITDEKGLDIAEAELSRANMMLLYEKGFTDFTPNGFCSIHKELFSDVYEQAGQYRKINIQKREKLLLGRSVWYSNHETIEKDLQCAFNRIHQVGWEHLGKTEFVNNIVHLFPAVWQVHPFREGNTRTVVMLITFFVEHYGYFMDQELLYANAGYVRNSFVLASLGEHSDFQDLETILQDAISETPVVYTSLSENEANEKSEKYTKYGTEYHPAKHEYIE